MQRAETPKSKPHGVSGIFFDESETPEDALQGSHEQEFSNEGVDDTFQGAKAGVDDGLEVVPQGD